MKNTLLITTLALFGLLAACTSPEEKAYEAQAESAEYESKIAEERLKLIDEYKECVKEADTDEAKLAACDSYLKASEALQ